MNEPKSSEPVAPILVLFGSLAVVLLVLVAPMASKRQVTVVPTTVPLPTPIPAQPTRVAIAYDPITVSAGEHIFQSTCAACHGFNAQGVPGLGKPLIGSDFVNGLTDDELVAFIIRGRDITDPLNTTFVMMPSKGGNPALSEANIFEVVSYIRAINASQQPAAHAEVQPTAVPAQVAAAPEEPSADPTPTVLGTPALLQGELNMAFTSGESAYLWSCAGCHGANGVGIPNVGPSLSDSELVDIDSGTMLFQFLVVGRPFADPRVEYPHPARGVYPQLTDEQIRSLIEYLYTLSGSN